MNHNAFNQGLTETARNHYADQPSIFATDAEMDEWVKVQERLKQAVTPYQEPPPLEARYIETGAQEVEPYGSRYEAVADLANGVFEITVFLAKPTIAIVIVGGIGFLAVSFFQGLAVGVTAFGASVAPVVGGAFIVVVVLALLSGLLRGDGEKKSPPAQSNGGTAQNITVVVNVAGNNVTTNSTGK